LVLNPVFLGGVGPSAVDSEAVKASLPLLWVPVALAFPVCPLFLFFSFLFAPRF
jgi:hypothetical protein